jgi:hypothetical protein
LSHSAEIRRVEDLSNKREKMADSDCSEPGCRGDCKV